MGSSGPGRNPAVRFVLQTNGTFLKGMKDELLAAVGTILVSVDGTEEHTDSCRGSGPIPTLVPLTAAARGGRVGFCQCSSMQRTP